ncbi:MAG: hypothetical protein P0Y53_25430 [Candidatus Pseudobacter hemicellulosilyticus]|uniref:Uncharacterized protein n=1 Tax=Candidatus Pseudobacter hemicellulosilyticus TaxID=3121375 RepID=A0AAJ6BH24_9BACT|nr:MAG: hypothetical protein P0Y53_25430 [Pseudobacter sp.]
MLTYWHEGLGISDYILYRLYTIIGYSLIAFFFYGNIISKTAKKIIIASYLFFLAYAIYDYIRQPLESFDSIPSAIEATLIIVFSIFYLFEQIKTPRVFFIYTLDKFWIITSFLIYYTGTFFLFIFAEAYFADPDFGDNYSFINSLFLLLKNVFFCIGLLISSKPNEYPPDSYPPFENYLENRI